MHANDEEMRTLKNENYMCNAEISLDLMKTNTYIINNIVLISKNN